MLEQLISSVTTFALTAGIKIVIALVVLIVGFKIIKVLTKQLKKPKKHPLDPSLESFLCSFVSIALKVVLLITVAAYLGLPMTSVVTVLGTAGVAIGLALQGGLSNVASGLMILLLRPFSVNDYIEAGGFEGFVATIGLFSTTLRTWDNRRVCIPNSTLTGSTVVNYSAEPQRRVDVDVNVAVSADPATVREMLLAVAAASEYALTDPAPAVAFIANKDAYLTFQVRVWCAAENYFNVLGYLMDATKACVTKAGLDLGSNTKQVIAR